MLVPATLFLSLSLSPSAPFSLYLTRSLVFSGSIMPHDNRHLTQCQLLLGCRYTQRDRNETRLSSLAAHLLTRPRCNVSLSPSPSMFLSSSLSGSSQPLCNDLRVHSNLVPNDTPTEGERFFSQAGCNAESFSWALSFYLFLISKRDGMYAYTIAVALMLIQRPIFQRRTRDVIFATFFSLSESRFT